MGFFISVLIICLLLFVIYSPSEKDNYKRLAKEITKDIEYKLISKNYKHPDNVYVREYGDLVIQLQQVGYSYKDVTIWKHYKVIASWTYESCNDIFNLSYYKKLFTYETLKPFFDND